MRSRPDMSKYAMLEWLYHLGYLTRPYVETDVEKRRMRDLMKKNLARYNRGREQYEPTRRGGLAQR